MKVLITGVTGFIGGGVLTRVFRCRKFDHFYVLMRPGHQGNVAERFEHILEELFSPEQRDKARARITPIAGELTAPELGLSASDRELLVANVNHIVHCSASTKFDEDMRVLLEINREGTRKLLELAKEAQAKGNFHRFDFVSTAYVSGDKKGEVDENDLERNQTFSNNYERSKYEAEKMLHSYRADIPITIFRPSIVVGQSTNGFTPHFRVLYWPFKLMATAPIPFVPCYRSAKLDVVPSDYVCRAIVALMQSDKSIGRTFHLTAGRGNETTVGGVVTEFFRKGIVSKRPMIPYWIYSMIKYSFLRWLVPSDFWAVAKKALPYKGYLIGTGVTYNNDKTARLLRELGVEPPHWNTYKDNIFQYVKDSRFGRRKSDPQYKFLIN